MSKPASAAVLRLARPDEHMALEDLMRRASLANEEDRPHLEANPDAIELPLNQIARGDVLVAELDGQIAGFAAVIIEDDRAELDGLFVEPDLWRRGIGTALIDAVAHQARRQGLTLMVVAHQAARPFYERCGFTVEEDAETRFGPAIRMSR